MTTNTGSKHVKDTHKNRPSITEVEWGGLKKEMPKHRPTLMKVDWGGKLRPTIQVDAYSLKLIEEPTIQVFSFTWSKLTMMESLMSQVFSFTGSKLNIMENHRTSSPQDYGEDYQKENISPHNYGEDHPRKTFSNLKSLCQ